MTTSNLPTRLFSALAILLCSVNSIFAQVPAITGVNHLHARIGETVTITGYNFSTFTNSIVRFGNVTANITSITSTQIVVTVPQGASYGPISYTVKGNYTVYSPKPFIQTFSPGLATGFVPANFKKRLEAVSGASPISICTPDIDGDGRPDVVVANFSSNSISIYRNISENGVMNFEPKKDYPVGVQPWFVTAADIDNDGKPDIMVANRGSNTVSVMENRSLVNHIDIKKGPELVTGAAPQGIAVADINQDGKADIVAVNYGGNSVSVFKNQGKSSVSFFAQVSYAVGAAPFSLVLADLNGDGKPDIATANAASNSVSLLVNAGTGNNSSFVDIGHTEKVGSFPEGIAAGDLNGDGRTDLVVANNFSNSISILQNRGGQVLSFEPKVDLSANNFPANIAIADMNGDARPDIAVAGAGTHVLLYRNTSANKVLGFDAKVTLTAGAVIYNVSVGDLDGDGKADIAVADQGTQSFSVVRNQINEPIIKSFKPVSAITGDTVHITGTHFTGATAVRFGGFPAYYFKVQTDSTMIAIPGQAQSGSVAVITHQGFDWRDGFIYKSYCAASSETGSSGWLDTITINGVSVKNRVTNGYGNFLNIAPMHIGLGLNEGSVKNNNPNALVLVYIDYNRDGDFDDKGELVFQSVQRDYSITKNFKFNIPPTSVAGLTTMRVRLFSGYYPSPCGTWQVGEAQDYGVIIPKIPPPVIHSFTATTAQPGDAVTIKGDHFDGATEVSFGGVKAFSYTLNSPKEIVAIVNDGNTGDVLVKTPMGGTATLAGFTFSPNTFKVKSFSPAKAGVDQEITILGTHFKNIKDVTIGGVHAYSFTLVSPEKIIAVIKHAASGNIVVTDAIHRADSLPGFTYLDYCISPYGSMLAVTENVTIDTSSYSNIFTRYHVYTNKLPPLKPGAHTITMNFTSSGLFYHYNIYYRAYIDLNQDGQFDASEQIGYARINSSNFPTLKFNFNITTAHLGVTRLRINYFKLDGTPPSGCLNNATGETQDYLVEIQPKTGRMSAPAFAEQPVVQDDSQPSLSIQALPNPTKTNFVLAVNSDDKQPVEIRVMDMAGRVLYQASGAANNKYTFGSNFAAGIYLAEVLQGSTVKKIKLVKAR